MVADRELATVEEACRIEVQAQKDIVHELRGQVALFRENFREQLQDIQQNTRKACEKDFEIREGLNYQE